MKIHYQTVGRLAAVLLCTTSFPAIAQSGSTPTASSPSSGTGGFDEIVVTARRRNESIQSVPATIQAINTQTLIERGIQTETDLQTAAPGLVVKANNNQFELNYVIRGEAVEPYSGSVPGVQPYVDEVALSGNTSPAFYDLENIQVLKGPQGTLFGRNATGGAVLYQTTRPKADLGGYVSVQYGNHDRLVTEAAVNAPIVADRVFLRLAGTYQSGGAFVRNLYDNKKLGDSKTKSGRGSLMIKPNDAITNVTMVQYSDFSGTNSGNFPYYVAPCGGYGTGVACWAKPSDPFYQKLLSSPKGTYFPGWPNGFVFPGALTDLPAFLRSKGRYVVDDNAPFPYHATDFTVVNTTTIELSTNLTLKNIFGYNKTTRDFAYDNDGTPLPLLQAGGGAPGGNEFEQRDTRMFSDELQLQGKALDNRLTYILGAFYSDNKTINNSPITGFGYIQAFDIPYSFAIRYKSEAPEKSFALFTQATYAVTDKLNLTGGVRGTWEKIGITQTEGSLFFGLPSPKTKESDISWTASADYRFSPEVMVYATTRGSWRVGGYNPFVAPVADPTATSSSTPPGSYFPPETVRDVEVGVKYSGEAGGTPIRLNVDLFNMWMKNIQKTAYFIVAGNITSTTVSIPAGYVRGFEVDGEIRPADWLTLGGNFSYNFAKYTKNTVQAYGGINVFGPFSDIPRASGTVFANITHQLPGEAGTLKFHTDAYGQSSYHFTSLGNTVNPGDKLAGYVLVNMRLDWSDPLGAKGLTASLFVKNLTNKFYFIGGSGGVNLFSLNHTTFGPPRTFGANVRFDF